MISSKPLARAQDLLDIRDKIKAFVVTAKGLAADGLTISEFAELCVALLRLCVDTLDSLPAEGSEKKVWTLEAIGLLYDELADKIVPTWAWPFWLAVRSPVRQLVLLAAAGAIEQILPLVRLAK